MSHPRKDIRDAVATLIIGAETVDDETTYATSAGARVYKSRVIPLISSKLPAVSIYVKSDVVEEDSIQSSPRRLSRKADLTVEVGVHHTQSTSADDALDTMETQILAALGEDPTLSGKCKDSILRNSEPEFFEQGDGIIGVLTMQFDVFYEQDVPNADDVELDDLKTVDTFYNLSNEQEDDDRAEDTLDGLDEIEE